MGRGLLLIASGLVMVVGLIQMSLNERQNMIPQRTIDYHQDQQAKNITGSMINLAAEEIKNNPNWKGSFTFSNYLGGSGRVVAYDQSDSNYPDSTNVGYAGGWNEYRVLLYAEATNNGYSTATEVLLEREAFTKYLYMTNLEKDNLWWFTGDTLNGPMHSNDQFQMAGKPVYNGFISSPQNPKYYQHMPTNPEFNGGTDWNAQQSPLPTDLTYLKTEAQSSSLRFDNPIKVFFEDGNVRILEKGVDWASAVEHNFSRAQYNDKVISTNGNVASVNGEVDGRVTLHAEGDIWITGDITYKHDPRTDTTSTDMFGMIAEKKVMIDDDAHRHTGNKDLNIFGALMALGSEMEVENYHQGMRGKLYLYGSKITEKSGVTGTFNGNGLASGYNLGYTYDPRFMNNTSPFFPRENFFSVVYWRDRKPVGFPN